MTQTSTLGLISATFETHADKTAVLFAEQDGQRFTFSDIWRRAVFFCPLIEGNFAPDAVVPIYLARGAQCLAVMIACVMTGRAFSVLNNRIAAPQLAHILEQTKAAALFADSSLIRVLSKSEAPQLDFLTDVEILLLQNEGWMPLFEKQMGRLRSDIVFTVIPHSDETGDSDTVALTEPQDPTARPAACLFTSGSTGSPKGVLVSDADLVARGRAEVESFEIASNDNLLSILPWSFDVGLSQVLTAWTAGCTLVIQNSWMPQDIVRSVSEHSVNGISAVPSIWIDFLASGLAFENPVPRYVTVSGGSLGESAQADLMARMEGTQVIRTYGQTETCRSSIAFPRAIQGAPTSVGVAYAGTNLYVVDDNLQALPPGSEGEILHTGDGVFLGYLSGDAVEKRIQNPFFDESGDTSQFAVLTGDYGRIDAQGRLYLLGRRDDMVKIKGNRVFLGEVIAEVEALEEVQEAVALQVVLNSGEPDPELALFATLSSEGEEQTALTLRKKLASRLPPYMLPSKIQVLDVFPRTASGKPDRQALKKLVKE